MNSGGNVFGSGIIGSPGFDITKLFSKSNPHTYLLQSQESFPAKTYHAGNRPTTVFQATIRDNQVTLIYSGILESHTDYQLTKSMVVKEMTTDKVWHFSYLDTIGWISIPVK